MHNYQKGELELCLQHRRIVYIGDSTVRQIFWATARKLDLARADKEDEVAEKHTNLIFGNSAVTIEFYWDPYLNSSSLHRHLTAASLPRSEGSDRDGAAIVMVGGGLWHARYLKDSFNHRFNHSITDISRLMTTQAHHSAHTADNLLVFAPVHTPLYNALAPSRAALTPDRISPLNELLFQLSREQGLPVAWAFSFMTRGQENAYEGGGLHVVRAVADRMADVLLNIRCNAILIRTLGYPMDKTCCMGYQAFNWTQYVAFVIALLPSLTFAVKGGRRNCHLISIVLC